MDVFIPDEYVATRRQEFKRKLLQKNQPLLVQTVKTSLTTDGVRSAGEGVQVDQEMMHLRRVLGASTPSMASPDQSEVRNLRRVPSASTPNTASSDQSPFDRIFGCFTP